MIENNINTMLQFPIATFIKNKLDYKQRSIGNRMTKTSNTSLLLLLDIYCHALDICVPFSVSQHSQWCAEHAMVCGSIE